MKARNRRLIKSGGIMNDMIEKDAMIVGLTPANCETTPLKAIASGTRAPETVPKIPNTFPRCSGSTEACNTVCIISKGRIVTQGSLDEVKTKMRGAKEFKIIIKVKGEMPRLTNTQITDATYKDGSAIVKAPADIRDEIAFELVRNGARLLELRMEEESLEDVFLETVYKGV
jgi:hypothetical protein